jgi:hypothetical protein
VVEVLAFHWGDENVVAEVRTERLPNAILEHNRYTGLFCKSVNCKENSTFMIMSI